MSIDEFFGEMISEQRKFDGGGLGLIEFILADCTQEGGGICCESTIKLQESFFAVGSD